MNAATSANANKFFSQSYYFSFSFFAFRKFKK